MVLLRDRRDTSGVEAYMLRRVPKMAFAPGMHVFPGGSVDPRDGDEDLPWEGVDPGTWAPRLGADPRLTRALVAAAVRETFEESGVLLAGPAGGAIVADTTGEGWEPDRLALLDRTLAMVDLLRRRGLVLRADLLAPWAHWVTPEFEERRFDTRFFLAALPSGQRTRDVGGEADLVAWVRPAEALRAQAAGEMAMLAPTVAVLRDLGAYASVAEVLSAAPGRSIAPVLPRAALVNGRVELLTGAPA